MKTKKNLANMMFMSIAAAATISFTACSDNDVETLDNVNKEETQVITAGANDRLLKPLGLVYKDFITENDVQILNADTTEICISKALADKKGITNFVNRPMGIWDKKENPAYLRRATEQRLVGDRYILKVTRSNIGEIVGNRSVKLNTALYYNPTPNTTRSANGIDSEEAKFTDEENVIHPVAITIKPQPANGTRGADMGTATFTVEDLYYDNYGTSTRGMFDWFKKKAEELGKAIKEGFKKIDDATKYNIDLNKQTANIMKEKSELKRDWTFDCGPEKEDTIHLDFQCPIEFNLNYTLEVHAQGQLSTCMLPKPTYLETYFDGYFGINPQLTVGFSKEVSLPKDKQRINLCKLTGFGTFFMIGEVPVYIDFDPSIYLKFTASLEGKAYIGLNYDFGANFKAGIKYTGGSPQGILEANIVKNDFNFITPTVEVEAKAGAGLMLGVDVIIDKIAGPTINVGPQFNAKANLIFAPWSEQLDMTAKVTAGCAGEVGAKIKVFGYELADWKWPFELGPQKTIFEYPKK